MEKLALDYYKEGYNCCQAIIMAAKAKYKLNIDTDAIKHCSCINNGMGVGSICCAIIGGVIVIGHIFEKKEPPEYTTLSHIRMKFINMVKSEFDSINCSQLKRLQVAQPNCNNIISKVAYILEKVINEYK